MSTAAPGTVRPLSPQIEALAADRVLLDRVSTAGRVADVLRTRIVEGFFRPGTRLAEDAIAKGLGVSRNTLRETFQLLSHERLVTHEFNRGVFVRELTFSDVVDLYFVRKLIECAAVRNIGIRRLTSRRSRTPSPRVNRPENNVTGRDWAPRTCISIKRSPRWLAAPG